ISHVWSTLTSTNASNGVGNNPGRLGQLGNSRGLYWSQGLKVGQHAPLAGVGAGGFDTARTRYTTNSLAFAHAHSYVIQTFADLADARGAATSDPVSVDPLWELSAIYTALGDRAAARHELVEAARLQPSNPQTWRQLGAFDVAAHSPTQTALAELYTALRLDP